ncbi:MAG: DUF983 domain-containing protein [Planctomycetota bacterium]|jgi:uncharacterized protein (DUF983 family)
MVSEPSFPPCFPTLVKRVLLRRCPVCGKGRIFRSFLRLRRTCADCGWVVEREPGTVTGSMYLVSVLTLLFAAGVFLLTWLWTDWPAWLRLAVGVPVITLFSLLALPVSRGVWAAVEYYTDLTTGETRRAEYEAKAFADERER